eukprot:3490500-Pyramimonas_sp.AAC.1
MPFKSFGHTPATRRPHPKSGGSAGHPSAKFGIGTGQSGVKWGYSIGPSAPIGRGPWAGQNLKIGSAIDRTEARGLF